MPKLSGIHAAAAIRMHLPDTVLAMISSEIESIEVEARKAGGEESVPKDIGAAELIQQLSALRP